MFYEAISFLNSRKQINFNTRFEVIQRNHVFHSNSVNCVLTGHSKPHVCPLSFPNRSTTFFCNNVKIFDIKKTQQELVKMSVCSQFSVQL